MKHFNVLSWKSLCGWYQTTYCKITLFSIGQGSATPNTVNDHFFVYFLYSDIELETDAYWTRH